MITIIIWICVWIYYPKKYKCILNEMMEMDKKIWIKMNTVQKLSLFPDNIYFLCESLPNCTDLLFVFINIDTVEISTAVYYRNEL